MTAATKGWLAARWERLSTGLKMLLIMSLGLLPLGIVAVFASIYSATENSEQRAAQTLERLDVKAQHLNELLARSAGTVRAAATAVAAGPPSREVCERTLQRLAAVQLAPARYALYGPRARLRCATPGFSPAPGPVPAGAMQTIGISPDGETLRLTLIDDRGAVEAVVEFSRETLNAATFIPGTRADFNLELIDGGRRMVLRHDYRPVPFGGGETLSETAPIADGALQLRIELGAVPVRAVDVFLILLPVLMWLAAAAIGWILVNRLLLRPLARMQRVVSAYRPGDRAIDLPAVRSPAREIAALGDAFDEVTRTVARHEDDLGAAVERQTRLVREVHHRVKNNLQVVASLLNLHSRGAQSEEVAAAYASIQRRVDALAVVHRNHYAELEENRGVALKPLISELAANLRASAPASAATMQIRLDVRSFHTTQDAAVSVAFLVTEVVEFGMLCGAGLVTILLEPDEPLCARLSVEVDSLAGGPAVAPELLERFDRIVTGLARQLRSTLERDPARGRYSVRVAVNGPPGAGGS